MLLQWHLQQAIHYLEQILCSPTEAMTLEELGQVRFKLSELYESIKQPKAAVHNAAMAVQTLRGGGTDLLQQHLNSLRRLQRLVLLYSPTPENFRTVAGLCLEQAAVADLGAHTMDKAQAFCELGQLYEQHGQKFDVDPTTKALEYYKKGYQLLLEHSAEIETETGQSPSVFDRQAVRRGAMLQSTQARLEALLQTRNKPPDKDKCNIS